jgi:hypothetical protein
MLPWTLLSFFILGILWRIAQDMKITECSLVVHWGNPIGVHVRSQWNDGVRRLWVSCFELKRSSTTRHANLSFNTIDNRRCSKTPDDPSTDRLGWTVSDCSNDLFSYWSPLIDQDQILVPVDHCSATDWMTLLVEEFWSHAQMKIFSVVGWEICDVPRRIPGSNHRSTSDHILRSDVNARASLWSCFVLMALKKMVNERSFQMLCSALYRWFVERDDFEFEDQRKSANSKLFGIKS